MDYVKQTGGMEEPLLDFNRFLFMYIITLVNVVK